MPRDTSSADERIAKLSERFQRHAVGRRPENTRHRERQSLYLDTDLIAEAKQAYAQVNHELFPATVNKSVFWEVLLRYGLDHLTDLKPLLAEHAGVSETAES